MRSKYNIDRQRAVRLWLQFDIRDDIDGCVRIRHSGRQRRFVSVLEFDIQGDTDGCVRIRHSGRQWRFVSVLEFDIQDDIGSILEFDIIERYRRLGDTDGCVRIRYSGRYRRCCGFPIERVRGSYLLLCCPVGTFVSGWRHI
jgi:hypothetical protein